MEVQVFAVLLLGLSAGPGLCSSGPGPGSDTGSERGRMELRRVRSLAAQPRYGECWSRALEHLDTRCRELTSESQSRIALRFTECHLSSSGRDFPSCPEGSEVSRCTAVMDAVAFNTFTEFFTHTHSMCQFLQSEAWQSRAEATMYRLTESSAGVAEQLESTRQMAEDLVDAQSAALQATQGLRSVFQELSSASREQQVALSELFNRVSFLQSFLLMEAHSLSSCCYNAAALVSAFLLTCTPRSSRARLLLLSLVCVNFYLERRIYLFVLNSDYPEHTHMELVSVYVSVLRRVMVCVGVCVLVCVCVQYRDPVQQSLQVLRELQETQRSLQEALQHAESLGEQQQQQQKKIELVMKRTSESRRGEETPRRRKEKTRQEEAECTLVSPSAGSSHLSHLSDFGDLNEPPGVGSFIYLNSPRVKELKHLQQPQDKNRQLLGCVTQNASVSPGRRPRRPPSSPLVYSILVEDKQPRYSLRSRRSETR